MVLSKPKRKKTQDPTSGEPNPSKPRPNGVKSASNMATASKEKALKKSLKKHPSKDDANSKKQKRKGDKDATSPPAITKKRKNKPEDDSSDGENRCYSCYSGECSQLPSVGDEIAVKCPPVPPYPEGWYSGTVVGVAIEDGEGLESSNTKAIPKSSEKAKNFTIHVEWDGGGEETLRNPEWRMKGDAPDKQGRVSHRDAKLRPYFKYWVNRLNSMTECEKKLSRSRAGKNLRIDPGQKIEWIQCCNPNCGKWRPLPPYMTSSAVLDSCNRQWYCVLNSWDEAMASCGAPQETGYMPAK